MEEYEIFNLSNLEDLPDKLKGDLKHENTDPFKRKILELFTLKSTLSVDEIQVGLYRKHGEYKSRRQVVCKLYNMSKDKIINRVRKSVYQYENKSKD